MGVRKAALFGLAAGLVLVAAPKSTGEDGAVGSSCTKPSDCPAQQYCDDDKNCYRCSYISSSKCDAIDGNCCSAAFRQQCTSNPHGCSGPPPPPGTTTEWHLASHDTTSCTQTCKTLGMTCDASTPPVNSVSKIREVARQLVGGPYTCDDYD